MGIEMPSPAVAKAFGVASIESRPMPGGQGVTFRAGDIVMKRCDDAEQTEWLSGILEAVEESGFRLARPVRSDSGLFVQDGWCATRWVGGTTAVEGRWHEAIQALQAFHGAVSATAYSPILSKEDNPWTRADNTIWSIPAQDLHIGEAAEHLRRLLRPVTLPSQVIQGDPSEGNLLFESAQPPAIIDIAPYWHPAHYSIAMLIADGIAWSRGPVSLLDDVADWPQMDQLLIRAVLFRLYVGYLFRGGEKAAQRRATAYAPVIHAVANWPAK